MARNRPRGRVPPPHPFEAALAATVRRGRLFGDGDRVVVALSAGPDSTALLLALDALSRGPGPRARLLAAHLDHGLRPGSAADAAAARALARSLGLPFRGSRLRGLRRRAKGSLEAAARAARYAFLARVARREGAAAVAVAHHRDDRVETVLHRLLQGGALSGLAGIPLLRPLPGAPGCAVVRPLFEVDRADVIGYLADRGVEAREDPTNGDGSNARARLRGGVLPPLLAAYPGARESLLRLADAARDASRILDQEATAAAAGWRIAAGSVRIPRSDFEGAGPALARRLLAGALAAAGCARTDPPRAAMERFLAALGAGDGRTRTVPVREGTVVEVGPAEVVVRVRVSSSAPRGRRGSRGPGGASRSDRPSCPP